MANTVSTISYANTFGQWMVATDALIGENNTLAKSDYTKDSGTIYLSETTKNALQSNGSVVVQKELLVQGPGSSATIDNNLTVYGQVYFSNTTLGLTNSGQANINGLLIAQGPGIGLYVANSAYVGGNTTIQYNTITNNVQANTLVNTATASITGTVYADVFRANSSVFTASLQANTTVLTNNLQANTSIRTGLAHANTSVLTGALQANTSVLTNQLQANTSVLTGDLQANTSILTGVLQANTSTNTQTSSVTQSAYADKVQANTSILTGVLQANTSTNTATASVAGTTFTKVLQANTSINTPIISVSNSVIANDIQANNVIGAPTLLGNTITANISATIPTLTVNTKLDGNNAAAFVNSLQVQGGGLTVNGNFILTGTTVYASNTFQLSTGVTSGISSYIQVDRGSSGANAAFRWNEPSLYWETLDVTGNVYSRVITENYLANQTGSSANSAFLKANSAYASQNTTGTYANSAFTKANSAYESQNTTGTYANTAFSIANSAFLKANSSYESQNTTGTYANSAFLKANSAYESQNTTGTYANTAFSTANSAAVYANGSFTQANAAFGTANSAASYANSAFSKANSAYTAANNAVTTFIGTTGSFSQNTVSFSSNNGVTFVVTSANNLAVSTSQDLRTTASPTFAGLTLTTPLALSQGGTGTTSASSALTALLPTGTTAGYVLTTGGPGNFYWAASSGGGGGVTPGTSINSTRLSYTANGASGYTGNSFIIPAATSGTQVRAYIAGVRQFESEYSLNLGANTITFTTTPPSGEPILIEVDGYYVNPYYANNIAFTVNSNISSTANTIQLAIDGLTSKVTTYYANLAASPTFSTVATGITVAAGTSNTAFATTAYVQNLANNSGTLTTNITGNAATVSNGVYTSGDQTIAGTKTFSSSISGSVTGSAATFTSTSQNSQFNSIGVGTAGSGTAGEIRATNEITAYYSDDNLKTRLGTIDNALDKLCSLTGFYYQANETAQALGYKVKREVGVSAQEVQKVMPEVVVPAPIDDKYLTIHYERLIPLLIESIKELKNEVDVLKGQIK